MRANRTGSYKLVQLQSRIAGNVVCKNAIKIEVKTNYNGSGPRAFGGVDEWPVVELHLPFPSDHLALAIEFEEELEQWVRKFIVDHGLDREIQDE